MVGIHEREGWSTVVLMGEERLRWLTMDGTEGGADRGLIRRVPRSQALSKLAVTPEPPRCESISLTIRSRVQFR